MKKSAVPLIMLALVSTGVAADESGDRLKDAISLKCIFTVAYFADWEKGDPELSITREKMTLHFDSIDLRSGKARLIGNHGAANVLVTVFGLGETFTEITPSGNLTFTTVFPVYRQGTNEFLAVHSRHLMLISHPLPSQYHGTCKEWN